VLFGLVLRVFFRAVRSGIGNYADDCHSMPLVFIERDSVALDLPSGAFGRSKLVFIVIIALLRQPVSVRVFLCVVFVVSCSAANPVMSMNTRELSSRS
jgi:hypothetical protein